MAILADALHQTRNYIQETATLLICSVFFPRTFFLLPEGVPSLLDLKPGWARRGPSLRPQGQATVALRGGVVDDAVERRAPRQPQVAAAAARHLPARGARYALRHLETHQVSHEALGLGVPAAAAACLRRSATRSTAPSTAAPHGCGCPDRVSGETSVASQHCAPPLRSAPYTTKSGLRRSCAPICGRWCWPATAAERPGLRTPLLPGRPAPRLAPRSWPAWRGVQCASTQSAWSPKRSTAPRQPWGVAVQRQRLSQAAPQSDLHRSAGA